MTGQNEHHIGRTPLDEGTRGSVPVTSKPPLQDARGRIGAWLMVGSVIGFCLYIAYSLVFFATTGAGDWSEITREAMDRIFGGWVIGQALVLVPYVLGLVGGALVAGSLLRSAARAWARAVLAVSAVSVAGNVAYSALMIAAAYFSGPSMAGNPLAVAATGPVVQFWSDPTSWASLVLLGLAIRGAGIRPRLGLTVAVIAGLGTVAALATGAVPPFALSFLWLALGVGWLTAPRSGT